MTPEHWRRLEELYDDVRDLPLAERKAVMDRADPEVRAQLEAILAQDRSALDHPAWEGRLDWTCTKTAVTSPLQLGPYKIEQMLGAGGMGEVYRAVDTRLGRTVAVKVLPQALGANPVHRQRFLQEARAVSALSHSNIVVLYDISSQAGRDFLVMEYVEGRTLKELIPAEGLPFDEVCALGAQVASALAAAHAAGIVHRDVKPANILVTREQQVKVLDFGIARMPRGETAAGLTGHGQIVGTVAYMSPEQTRGEEIDARSDMFSFGCVLYECATGRSPFAGRSALEVMHRIAAEDPPSASSLRPGLPMGFDSLVARCLRKAKEERFSSMSEVHSGLDGSTVSFKDHGSFAPPLPSVAVLPFANAGADPELEHFADGLADELIGVLARMGRLKVAGRTSAFSFRGKTADVREIGRALNVDAVIEGSIRRSSRRLRINVQLVQVSDGFPIWAERFDRELTDVFELQDELRYAVVGKLRKQLLGEGATGPAPRARRFTEDPEAYSLFLKGRYHWGKRPAGTYAAIECFQQALQRDPAYALAWASLSDCYNTLGSWEAGILSPEEAYSKGRAYAEKSLQLDPTLAEGHTALGYGLLHFAWDLPAAERSILEAIRLNAAHGPAHHWYSHLLAAAHRLEESLVESRHFLSIDPAEPLALAHMCWHYLMAHDFPAAEAASRKAVGQEPNFGWHHIFLGWALLVAERPAEALSAMETGVKLSNDATVFANFAAHAHAVLGQRDMALAQLERLDRISREKYASPYEIGLTHEALGNLEEAFNQWELAFEQRSPWLVYLAREPRLVHLHGQPRFDALVDRIHRIMHRATGTGLTSAFRP
jgi:serine/threonine-protein kinase